MKKAIVFMVAVFFFSAVTLSWADPNPSTINVTATVRTGTELNWWMNKYSSKLTETPNDDFVAGNQTSMLYETLDHWLDTGKTQDAGVWFSQIYYGLFMTAITGGAKYKLTSSSSGLGFDGVAWGITYIGCRKINADGIDEEITCPSGSTLGSKGTASVSGKVLYDSGAGAAYTVVRADFAIPPDGKDGVDPFPGWTGVPLSQTAGTYSGTLQLLLSTY